MFNLTNRLLAIEQQIAQWLRDWTDLLSRLVRLEQNPWLQQGPIAGGSNGTTGWYVANHLNLTAATGTFPSITPTSTTAAVYVESGGSLVEVSASATIYNFGPDATDSTKRQYLAPNGDGTYSLVGQSCNPG